MRAIIKCSAIILALAVVTPANAKGCLKGALVGGVAGHYTVHHGLLGAPPGSTIGLHITKQRVQTPRAKRTECDDAPSPRSPLGRSTGSCEPHRVVPPG